MYKRKDRRAHHYRAHCSEKQKVVVLDLRGLCILLGVIGLGILLSVVLLRLRVLLRRLVLLRGLVLGLRAVHLLWP